MRTSLAVESSCALQDLPLLAGEHALYHPHRGSRFWARHPLLSALFFVVWSVLATVFIIGLMSDGRFTIAAGRGYVVTRTGSPFWFWSMVAATGLAGLYALKNALREFARSRGQ